MPEAAMCPHEPNLTLGLLAATLFEEWPAGDGTGSYLGSHVANYIESHVASPRYQLASAVYETVEAVMHGDEQGVFDAAGKTVSLINCYLPTNDCLQVSGELLRAMQAATWLLTAVQDRTRDLEDAVLRSLVEGGEEYRAKAVTLASETKALIAVLGKAMEIEEPLVPHQRLRSLERGIDSLLADLPAEDKAEPFAPLSETDTVLLNYVDLDLLKVRYGYARVPVATLRTVRQAGYGFGDLVRHYLREDLPDWVAATFGLDVRQAQLIAAGIASVNETYRLFSTKQEAVMVHRDAIVVDLLCDDNYCRH